MVAEGWPSLSRDSLHKKCKVFQGKVSVIMVYFSVYFLPFYPTLNLPSSFSHAHDSRTMKTRHKKSLYWYKDKDARLHCTQNRHHHRWVTASSTHLFNNPRTFEGHVEFSIIPFTTILSILQCCSMIFWT